ncbi:hypothetical protein SAMN05216390_102142 [Lachnospiraceae bacterium KH1T2]|nr:hypothetical protein SAMN05216390_102142 [Lachnospiraceae bacterium KH1T2]
MKKLFVAQKKLFILLNVLPLLSMLLELSIDIRNPMLHFYFLIWYFLIFLYLIFLNRPIKKLIKYECREEAIPIIGLAITTITAFKVLLSYHYNFKPLAFIVWAFLTLLIFSPISMIYKKQMQKASPSRLIPYFFFTFIAAGMFLVFLNLVIHIGHPEITQTIVTEASMRTKSYPKTYQVYVQGIDGFFYVSRNMFESLAKGYHISYATYYGLLGIDIATIIEPVGMPLTIRPLASVFCTIVFVFTLMILYFLLKQADQQMLPTRVYRRSRNSEIKEKDDKFDDEYPPDLPEVVNRRVIALVRRGDTSKAIELMREDGYDVSLSNAIRYVDELKNELSENDETQDPF